MSAHNPKTLNALVDGELKGIRRWFTERHLQSCAACATEFAQLQRIRQLLVDNPVSAKMSDSPEFFWSKVKHEIETREDEQVKVETPRLSLGDTLLQHCLAIASSAVAAIAILWIGIMSPVVQSGPAIVKKVATSLPNTVATVVRTDSSDIPVIWVSGLNWTRDMSEMKTHFANPNI